MKLEPKQRHPSYCSSSSVYTAEDYHSLSSSKTERSIKSSKPRMNRNKSTVRNRFPRAGRLTSPTTMMTTSAPSPYKPGNTGAVKYRPPRTKWSTTGRSHDQYIHNGQ
mmetsp:Transcript_49269/g.59713  ORF Transcript_49269/g.59713 Transcript_49269/m.59713 type:complete len:108 (-) Transcript_49269:147-470(-)